MNDNRAAPWSRRPNEGERPWAMFTVYRDLPPDRRSLPVVRECAESAPSVSLLKRWSARFDWRARAAAYDVHRDAVRCAAVDDGERDAAVRTEELRERLHAKLAAMIDAAETPADLLLLARAWDLAGVRVPEPPALPLPVTAPPAGWRITPGPFPAPTLDRVTNPQEGERRFRSVLAILADAGVVTLPDGSTEPGHAPQPQEVY